MRFLLILLFACSSQARETHLPASSVPPWCFPATAFPHGFKAPFQAVGCFDTSLACERARKLAVTYGPLAGITSVGVCATRVSYGYTMNHSKIVALP